MRYNGRVKYNFSYRINFKNITQCLILVFIKRWNKYIKYVP